MTGLAVALAAIFMGLIPQSADLPVVVPAAVEVPQPGGGEGLAPPIPPSTVPSPPPLPDVEFDDDETRSDTGAWPSPIYQCASGVTDAAQMASVSGRPLAEVVTSLEQNCTRL